VFDPLRTLAAVGMFTGRIIRKRGAMTWKMATTLMSCLLLSAASAPKGWQQMAPGQLLCSEPADDSSSYEVSPLQPGKPIRFRFKLVTYTFDPTHPAVAAVLFDAPAAQMRFVLAQATNDPRHIYIALQGVKKGQDDWLFMDLLPVSSDWIDVKLELDSKGVVQAASENGRGSLPLGTTQPIKTRLYCASGEFEIEMSPIS
jgi:hypothetical protein